MKLKIYLTTKCWLALSILLSLMVSCTKYLDKKNNTSLVSPATLQDAQALLDYAPTMNEDVTPLYGAIAADEYFISDEMLAMIESFRPGSINFYTWRYFPLRGGGNDWSFCYRSVYTSNLALEVLRTTERNTANAQDWDNIKGSALFFRSYYFLQLLWNYAKAYDSGSAAKDWGIVLRQSSNFNEPSVRATNEQCYRQVIDDTKTAITLLPAYPLQPTRPAKGAAYGLLARCYFSMRDYLNALRYADSCLQLHDQLMNYNADSDVAEELTAFNVFKKFNKEMIFYTEMSRSHFMYSTAAYSRIDTIKHAGYTDTDLRKKAFFYPNTDGYYSFKGSYATNYSNSFSGLATDEVYLMRAEAYLRTGELEKGLKDIRKLMENRYATGSVPIIESLSLQEALELVMQERERELITRGLRWMDLKRLNKEGAGIIVRRLVNGQLYELLPNSTYYALPIPEDIIELSSIPQNE